MRTTKLAKQLNESHTKIIKTAKALCEATDIDWDPLHGGRDSHGEKIILPKNIAAAVILILQPRLLLAIVDQLPLDDLIEHVEPRQKRKRQKIAIPVTPRPRLKSDTFNEKSIIVKPDTRPMNYLECHKFLLAAGRKSSPYQKKIIQIASCLHDPSLFLFIACRKHLKANHNAVLSRKNGRLNVTSLYAEDSVLEQGLTGVMIERGFSQKAQAIKLVLLDGEARGFWSIDSANKIILTK